MIRLFRVYLPVGVFALLLSEIVITTLCFLLVSFLVLTEDLSTYLLYENGIVRLVIVIASIILGFYLADLYGRIHVKSRMRLLQDLCQVFGVALLVQGVISYAMPELKFGRGIMLLGSLLSLVVLFMWRLVCSAYVLKVVGSERILFVDASPIMRELAMQIASRPELGLSIQGYLDDTETPGTDLFGAKVLGPVADLGKIAAEIRPSRIVVGRSGQKGRISPEALLELRFAGFTIEDSTSMYEAICGRLSTQELSPDQLIFSGGQESRAGSRFLQDFVNLAIGLIGAIVTLPLMALVAIIVKSNSRGPVFSRQVCVGKDGALFVIKKFRSICADIAHSQGSNWTSRDDPRLTSIGGWLRRLRLDELPLLFNLLRGDISLVGPRPEPPEFVESLAKRIPYYRQRHSVKPGITSWAQVNRNYADNLEDTVAKLEYDLYYIKNISPSLDAYIVLHTLKTIILARSA